MKIIYIVDDEETGYVWNGNASIPFASKFPSMAFEDKTQADEWARTHGGQVWEVNFYAAGEVPTG